MAMDAAKHCVINDSNVLATGFRHGVIDSLVLMRHAEGSDTEGELERGFPLWC